MISEELGFALGFGSLLLLVCLGYAAAKETIIIIIIINVIFLLLDPSLGKLPPKKNGKMWEFFPSGGPLPPVWE